MSDLEVLQKVITTLDHINVPVQYTEQIAVPLINSNTLLKELYKAIINQIKEKEATQKNEEEIRIEKAEVVDEIPEDAEELPLQVINGT